MEIKEYLYWIDANGDVQEQSFKHQAHLEQYMDECWPNSYVPELWNASWGKGFNAWFWYSNRKYKDNFPQSDSLSSEDEQNVPKQFRMLHLLK